MGVFGGFGEGLGVYRGAGEWGVTTLKINPVTNDYYVSLFENVSDAITYARDRAYQSGLAAKGGSIQYVVQAPVGQHDRFGRRVLYPVYRILRVFEPILDRTGHRPPGPPRKDEQWVLVLKNAGITAIGHENPDLVTQGKGIRWQKVSGLSIRVPDYEEALALAKAQRGSQQISRQDRIVRGHKQKVRQGRAPKTGPGPTRIPTSPVKLMDLMRGSTTQQEHEEQARERDQIEFQTEVHRAAVASLKQQLADLKARVEQIQSNIMRQGGPSKAPEKLLSELEMAQERYAELMEEAGRWLP